MNFGYFQKEHIWYSNREVNNYHEHQQNSLEIKVTIFFFPGIFKSNHRFNLIQFINVVVSSATYENCVKIKAINLKYLILNLE